MTAPDFDLTVSEADGRTTVAVVGELDIVTADRLRDALAAIDGDGAVVVDVGGLGFVDSAGLGVLARAAVSLAQRGVRLTVARPSSTVRRLLEITGLEQAVDLVDELP